MPSSSFDRSFPAAPTKGTPCLSSWNPGASPTNIRSAVGEPDPKTTCVRPAASAHRVQPATTSPYAIRLRSAAASTATAATPAAEAGLSGGAVRREGAAELLRDLRVPAVGAHGIRIGHPDELLEMGLAAHADVVIDRHGEQTLARPILATSPDGRTGARHRHEPVSAARMKSRIWRFTSGRP